ncbi:hypothetical protein EVAR_74982_1 [Eumeta japonica]|uniref:Uncharacterized protein n=1 Tax=Eumeta variegata TaxID=151549 RepID=A0A4C1VBL4_EUMVA|nr:hypothetical protein EVAR_74982_1 [Eumeta japonica]
MFLTPEATHEQIVSAGNKLLLFCMVEELQALFTRFVMKSPCDVFTQTATALSVFRMPADHLRYMSWNHKFKTSLIRFVLEVQRFADGRATARRRAASADVKCQSPWHFTAPDKAGEITPCEHIMIQRSG